MKYSSLIRKLVIASEECNYAGTDIAERLKYRCVPSADIIRQTLMNAVCDPRFKLHIDSIPSWRERAIQQLENFAQQLVNQPDLDDNSAQDIINDMLVDWLRYIAEEKEQELIEREEEELPQKELSRQEVRDMEEAIKEFCPPSASPEHKDSFPDFPLIPNDNPDIPDGGDTGAVVHTNKYKGKDSSQGKLDNKANPDEEIKRLDDDKDDEEDAETNNNPKFNEEESRYKGAGIGKGDNESIFAIETRFVSRVPKSLITLAKLIGCAGDDVMDVPGAFHSASKSDISGVMMSDDISSMLPTELAIMSDAATQNVFYHRYATKRLQTFSSASHGRGRKLHHDGPIIICLDTSSSMCGEPITVAVALTIAIAIIAQRMKRNVLVVKYSDSHYVFNLHNIFAQREELMKYLSSMGMGGNDENSMFIWLFREILPNAPAYSSADILCISDFGWTPIRKDAMEMIAEEKERGMTFYGLNIGSTDQGYYSLMTGRFGSPESVCDSMWEYSNGLCRKVR